MEKGGLIEIMKSGEMHLLVRRLEATARANGLNIAAAIRARACEDVLWCESCGEAEQEVRTDYAGLCRDCAEKEDE